MTTPHTRRAPNKASRRGNSRVEPPGTGLDENGGRFRLEQRTQALAEAEVLELESLRGRGRGRRNGNGKQNREALRQEL